MFPRDMVCLRNRSVDTLHKGDTEDDDDDDDNNNNNNNNNGPFYLLLQGKWRVFFAWETQPIVST